MEDLFTCGGGASASSARRSGPSKGQNVVAEIEISFEDAAFGCEQQITYSRIESCPTCHGSGCKDGAQPETCTYCRGTGTVRTQQNFMGMTMQSQQPCPKCGGAGKIIKDPCQTCKGKGKVRHTKTIKVSSLRASTTGSRSVCAKRATPAPTADPTAIFW